MDARGFWIRTPWWVLSLASGSIFGLGQFAFRLIAGDSVVMPAVTATIMGLVFGLLMGPFTHRFNRRFMAAMGDLPIARHREVRKAAMRGPVPADPEVGRAAFGVVAQQIDTFRKLRWGSVLYGVMLVMAAVLAVVDSPWWVLSALLFLGLLSFQLWMPRHLRRRQRLLSGATPAAAS